MDWVSLLGIAVALAMDALAVALATGLGLAKITGRRLFRMSFHFGLFQGLMPILGWLAGRSLHRVLSGVDHWIAFVLLALVGGKMIYEARKGDDAGELRGDPTRGFSLIFLALATSIDALAVGLSLGMLGLGIWRPALVIGLVCGVLTAAGMVLGRRIGARFGPGIEVVGGLVLIAIGCRILWEHLAVSS